MPGISTGGRGHYCPNYDDCYDGCSYETMALWHRRIHRQRHRGLYTAPHLSRSGHAVLATSTHYSPASGLGIIQIQYTLSSDYRDLCRGSFIVTVLSYTIQVDVSSIVLRMFLLSVAKRNIVCGCVPHSITSCPISPVYDIECGPLDK